jgi:hypothetical protein
MLISAAETIIRPGVGVNIAKYLQSSVMHLAQSEMQPAKKIPNTLTIPN